VILFDTDVCVSLLRGNAGISERLRRQSGGASVCFMTVAELAYGAEKSAYPDDNCALVERFLLTAAVALSRGLVLATGNLKHFSRIPGLVAEDWIGA
jgi:tRNA(fMet)-specific endonuclease VapC